MVSQVNSHTNATRIGWYLWEMNLRFAHGLPPGWSSTLMRSSDEKPSSWFSSSSIVRCTSLGLGFGFHVETLVIYQPGFLQNHYTFALILIVIILLCKPSLQIISVYI